MNRYRVITMLCFLFLVILIGCENTEVHTNDIKGKNTEETSVVNTRIFESLEEILEERGYQVSKLEVKEGTTPHTFLSVYPTYIEVNDETLAIYVYEEEKLAKDDSKIISNDGFRIGNSIVEWVDDPHFYQTGRIIVSYIGSNTEILYDLESILGKPITE